MSDQHTEEKSPWQYIAVSYWIGMGLERCPCKTLQEAEDEIERVRALGQMGTSWIERRDWGPYGDGFDRRPHRESMDHLEMVHKAIAEKKAKLESGGKK